MPLYEYRCRTCDERFELRRAMSDSDLATPCPEGHDDTVRLLSMFGVQTGASRRPGTSRRRRRMLRRRVRLPPLTTGRRHHAVWASTTVAQLRPLAPQMPAPGNVAAPVR